MGLKSCKDTKKNPHTQIKLSTKKLLTIEYPHIAGIKRYQQKNVHKYIAKYLAISLFFRIFKGWVGGDVLTYCDVRYDGN